MTSHDTWKLGLDDPYFDSEPDYKTTDFMWDGDIVAPVYMVGDVIKRTATQDVLTQDKADEIMDAWVDSHTCEEITSAEKAAERLVRQGFLK